MVVGLSKLYESCDLAHKRSVLPIARPVNPTRAAIGPQECNTTNTTTKRMMPACWDEEDDDVIMEVEDEIVDAALATSLHAMARVQAPRTIRLEVLVASGERLASPGKCTQVQMKLQKKKLGADHVMLDVLPEVNSIDLLIPSLKVVLDQRVRKGKTEILVHWKGLSPADSTWNVRDLIQERFLDFILEDEDAL
ncbi:hypothetical protein Pint_17219 [Pistacia integerrima]|uniref:Uncharacterized protein n=1 Tax=Pistacia integerrima TaxID=434235 RepID=A0ACC0YWQ2_9ROSI|nr:hypothetical protein Pint_17219 [Pistacia integerrima]